MTAIVGILNKQAVAVAADSAETVGSGLKIYNKANKVFALSKYHPVGIAIYSNAQFNSCIPWETVIKMYRKKLGKTSFSTLIEYKNDFYKYVAEFRKKYITEEEEKNVFIQDIYNFWKFSIVRNLPRSDYRNIIVHPIDFPLLKSKLEKIEAQKKDKKVIDAYKKISRKQFEEYIEEFTKLLETKFAFFPRGQKLFQDNKQWLIDKLFNICVKDIDSVANYTGIAFFGYGETEIFPSLCHTKIYNTFYNVLYHVDIENDIVSNKTTGAVICPMAQTDVIKTYIEGISPEVEQTFISSTIETIKMVLQSLHDGIKKVNPGLANDVLQINLKPVLDQYIDGFTKFKHDSIVQPLMDTVATMEKEDLAELAENLIYLTSLKRRITPNLESVGGPVDVAVISKGDGFVWLKRKHYFNPELNKSYFDKYLSDNN